MLRVRNPALEIKSELNRRIPSSAMSGWRLAKMNISNPKTQAWGYLYLELKMKRKKTIFLERLNKTTNG